MRKFYMIMNLLKNDKITFWVILLKKFNFLFPDKLYLLLMFRLRMGYSLDLKNPKTFNEKIQWLKLYNRNPFYTTLVDKSAVKSYVAKVIGEEFVIPTLGVWNNADEINFEKLPSQFVLKTTNGGGGDVIICKDKTKLNKKHVIKHLNQSLQTSIYNVSREWPYKNITPHIIAEKYMEDERGELRDYKFFCFDGVIKCLQVDYDRFVEHHRNIYDTDWNLLPFEINYPSKRDEAIPKPLNFNIMKKIVERLSKNIPHVRVDLYNINGAIYFGEMTFYHGSGYEKFNPCIWDNKFGEWLNLPPKM